MDEDGEDGSISANGHCGGGERRTVPNGGPLLAIPARQIPDRGPAGPGQPTGNVEAPVRALRECSNLALHALAERRPRRPIPLPYTRDESISENGEVATCVEVSMRPGTETRHLAPCCHPNRAPSDPVFPSRNVFCRARPCAPKPAGRDNTLWSQRERSD